MKIKTYWNANTVPAFLIGLIIVVGYIGIFYRGTSNGIIIYSTGFEAQLSAILKVCIGILLMSRIFYIKKDRDFNIIEFLLYIVAYILSEIIPHIIEN